MALASGIGCVVLGLETRSGSLGHYFVKSSTHGTDMIGVPVDLETGFNGGAIGLGIISAVCILCLVWVEITKFKFKDK